MNTQALSTSDNQQPFVKKNLFFISMYGLISLAILIHSISFFGADLLAEEAYYWNYAQHLDWSYLDHPPLVALLIKLSTVLFGNQEWAIRLPALLCWLVSGFFVYKLSEKITPGSGKFSGFLIAILPFFFLQSLVITPDAPLVACWAAALFFLYQALVETHKKSWYWAGIALGLGMLSKYSIVLLGLASLFYMIIASSARPWFTKKEPYLCCLIVMIFFTPVIYWNASHEWVSFLFQTTRRLNYKYHCSLHELVGLLVFFLMPLGTLGLIQLFYPKNNELKSPTRLFLQVFWFVPFAIFAFFSLNHAVKFNWIGPSLLILLPWLAGLIHTQASPILLKNWLITGTILLIAYGIFIGGILTGKPEKAHQLALKKYIAWEDLYLQFHQVAAQIADTNSNQPVLIPLDLYNLASEFNFYQTKLFKQKKITHLYPILGRDVFGQDSLMFRYWNQDASLADKTFILISSNPRDFEQYTARLPQLLTIPLQSVWAHSQGQATLTNRYYYKIVAF